MKALPCFCFFLVAGASCTSYAENWVEIGSDPKVGGHVYHLDDESITPAGDGIYNFAWRNQDWSPDRSYLTNLRTEYVKANCKQEILEIEKSISVDGLESRIKNRPVTTVIDYKRMKRVIDGTEMHLDKFSQDLMLSVSHIYPTRISLEGKVLQAICKSEYFPKELRKKYSVAVQEYLGCRSAGSAADHLCQSDETTIELVYSMRFRVDQLKEACSIPEDQVGLVLSSWGERIKQCRVGGTDCATSLLRNNIYSIGAALTTAKVNNDCSWFKKEVENAKSQKERSASTARFGVCTKKAITELDDGISPVETIANSVISYCRPILNDDFPKQEVFDQFAGIIRPQVATQILQFRQALRRAPPPKEPKKPKRYES
jgi:hypothetical protein